MDAGCRSSSSISVKSRGSTASVPAPPENQVQERESSENSICTAHMRQHAVERQKITRLRNPIEKLAQEVCSIETRLKFNVVLSRVSELQRASSHNSCECFESAQLIG